MTGSPQLRETRWRVGGRLSLASMTGALSLASGVLVWELLARMLGVPFFPPFTQVFVRTIEMIRTGQVLGDLAWSIQNLVVGFLGAAVLGVAVGLLLGRVRWLEEIFDPYLYAFLTAPTVVFVPIYFTIFGLSRWAIIALIFQYAVFIIVVNSIAAVKTVDRELMEMASVFGASNGLQMTRTVVVPAAMPLISAGLRLGMGRAVKGMINGEILLAVVGLGGKSSAFGRAFDAEGVLALLLVVITVALLADRLMNAFDARVNAWLPSTYR